MTHAEAIARLERRLATAEASAVQYSSLAALWMDGPFTMSDAELEMAGQYGQDAATAALDVLALQLALDALRRNRD